MNYFIALFFTLTLPFSFADQVNPVELSEGDLLVIGPAKTYGYDYIKFAKANFLRKKGKIADYKKVSGMIVKITEISEDQSTATLSPTDRDKFYDGKKEVKVSLKKALEAGEISILKP